MRNLSLEQIDGIAREIGDMALQGHEAKAWGWVHRIRRTARASRVKEKYRPCATQGCKRYALRKGRYCNIHEERLDLLRAMA